LRLAFAATAHKVQGQTIKKPNYLVADLRKVREPAQAYVILSRVQTIEQLFLIGDACVDRIYASSIALEEVKRMVDVALNLQEYQSSIVSCNIRSLRKNVSKLAKSSLTANADVVCLQETWTEKPQSVLKFFSDRYTHQHENYVGKGKGIISIYDESFTVEKDVQKPLYQITKLRSKSKVVMNIYRSQGANTESFIWDLLELMDLNEHMMIVGDFNIIFSPQNPINFLFFIQAHPKYKGAMVHKNKFCSAERRLRHK